MANLETVTLYKSDFETLVGVARSLLVLAVESDSDQHGDRAKIIDEAIRVIGEFDFVPVKD